MFWSRASDRIGRRPILLLGPVGLATAMFALGMSTTFWGMVWGRCLQGTFNGNIGASLVLIFVLFFVCFQCMYLRETFFFFFRRLLLNTEGVSKTVIAEVCTVFFFSLSIFLSENDV